MKAGRLATFVTQVDIGIPTARNELPKGGRSAGLGLIPHQRFSSVLFRMRKVVSIDDGQTRTPTVELCTGIVLAVGYLGTKSSIYSRSTFRESYRSMCRVGHRADSSVRGRAEGPVVI